MAISVQYQFSSSDRCIYEKERKKGKKERKNEREEKKILSSCNEKQRKKRIYIQILKF